MKPYISPILLFLVPQLSQQLALEKPNAVVSGSTYLPSLDQPLALVGRQQQPAAGPKKDTCDRCATGKCRGLRYRDTKTCRCTRCPDGQKPNPTSNGCIPDNDNSDKKCPTGQKLNPAGDACIPDRDTPCPVGQKPSPSGDGCVGDDDKKNPCPPGQKFEPAANGCVSDKPNPENEKKKEDEKRKQEERKQKKDKLVKDTIPRKKDAYNKKLRDEQKKKEDEQKKQRTEKKKALTEKARGKKRFEFQRNRKRTRMGKCLLLAPLSVYGSIEGISSEEYLTDFFSEEFVSSEAIDELWPTDFLDPLDVDIDSEEYMKSFIEIAAQEEDDKDTRWKPKEPIGVKREEIAADSKNVPQKFRRTPLPIATTTDLEVGLHQHDKRNPLLFIARIIAQFAGRLGEIGIQVAGRFANVAERVGVRLANLNARGGARLAKNGGTKGGDAMSKGGRAVSNSKNWRNCLNGANPVK